MVLGLLCDSWKTQSGLSHPQGDGAVAIELSESADLFKALEVHPAADALIVDFDETLWLRNSTEEFLASVRPRFLAAMVLQLLGVLRPWRLLGNGKHHRDRIRTVAILLVAPWSLWRWRRQAAMLGPKYLNRPLLRAIRARPRTGIGLVTFGFREIVKPLLSAIDSDFPLVESCSLWRGPSLRIEGKASALRRHIGPDRLRHALVITDSIVDADLLDASDKAFLVQWPGALYEQAGLRPLMPFVYLQRVKRPDEDYVRNAIFGHDFPVLILAYALASSSPFLAAAAILVFMIGFFTAYEVGYYENDRLGLKIEIKPKVSKNFHSLGRHFSPPFAWSVAIVLTGLASLLAYQSISWIPEEIGDRGVIGFVAVWAAFVGFLIVMRLLFRWLNTIDTKGRIVPMLGLQVGRVMGYAVVLPTTVIGVFFCVAHGLSHWLPYVVYRFDGSRKDFPTHLVCFLLLGLSGLALAIGGNLAALLTWQSLLIFGYAASRAAKDLLAFRWKLLPVRPDAAPRA